MSGADSARVQRSDSDHDYADLGPTQETIAEVTPGSSSAHAAAGDAATEGILTRAGHAIGHAAVNTGHAMVDASVLAAELALAFDTFNVITGDLVTVVSLDRFVDLGQRLLGSRWIFGMLTLGGTPRGSNQVFLHLNVWKKTLEATSGLIAVGSFNIAGTTGKAAEMHGVRVKADQTSDSVTFQTLVMHDVAVNANGVVGSAKEIDMQNCTGTKSGAVWNVSFGHATIQGLSAPNAPVGNIEVAGGANFSALWAALPKATAAAPAASGPAPAVATTPAASVPDVFPADAKVNIKIIAPNASGTIAGANSYGQGGFAGVKVALDNKGGELASISIWGFHASGSASAADARIDKVELVGTPPLVEALMSNPTVASDPPVAHAMQLIRQLGIKAAVSGKITVANLSANHAANGDFATADFSAHLEVDGIGALDVAMPKFMVGTGTGVGVSFASFSATLTDPKHAELAHVDIAGSGASTTQGGALKQIHARGNLGAIARAVTQLGSQLPPPVRAAFAMVSQLGVTADLSGSVSATASKSGALQFDGTFTAHLDAPDVGKITVTVADFRGTEGANGATFRHFNAELNNAKGTLLAGVGIANASFSTAAHGSAFSLGKLEVHGNTAGVSALIAAVEKQAPTLPPAIKSAFDMVQGTFVGVAGSITLSNVRASDNGKGTETAAVGDVTAHFAMSTKEQIDVKLTGFHGTKTPGASYGPADMAFDMFDAKLVSPTAGNASILVDGGGGHLGAATKSPNGPDYNLHAHRMIVSGEVHSINTLMAALRTHLGHLPPPIVAAFNVVSQYASSQALNGEVSASLDATNVNASNAHGRLNEKGDLSARVEVAGSTVQLGVHGFNATGTAVEFASLDLTVVAPGGQTAGSLHAVKAERDAKGTLSIASVTADGQVSALRAVLGAVGAKLPPAVASALATIDDAHIEAALTAITVSPGANGTVRIAGAADAKARITIDGDDVDVTATQLYGSGSGQLGFAGFTVKVLDPQGQVAATLDVGSATRGADGKIVIGAITATGDAPRLRKVLNSIRPKLTDQLGAAFDMIAKDKIDLAVTHIVIAPTAGGGVAVSADNVHALANISFKAGTTVYRSSNAQVTMTGAKTTMTSANRPSMISASSVSISGNFQSRTPGHELTGVSTLVAGATTILFDAKGRPSKVTVVNAHLNGTATNHTEAMTTGTSQPVSSTSAATAEHAPTGAIAPTTTATPTPTKPGKPGKPPKTADPGPTWQQEQTEVEDVAKAVKNADVAMTTPILPGRYGNFWLHVDVPPGAMLHTSIQVRDRKFTNGTRAMVTPKLASDLWIKATGVALDTKGDEGELKLKLQGFFDINLTKYLVGKSKLTLNLADAVNDVMQYVGTHIVGPAQAAQAAQARAQQNATAPTVATAAPAPELAAGAPEPATAKPERTLSTKEQTIQPRAPSAADIATVGIELTKTTGTASIELNNPAIGLEANLSGSASAGGVIDFAAPAVQIDLGGNDIQATGVAGNVEVTPVTNGTEIDIHDLRFDTLTVTAEPE